MRNLPGELQRSHIVDRGSDALVVQGNLVAVVHGWLGSKDKPASLIVTDFKFLPKGSSRRFVSAVITYSFASMDSMSPGPIVDSIAPKGFFALNPPANTMRKTSLSPAAPLPGVGVEALGQVEWELREDDETTGHATLAGTMRMEPRSGYRDTARWALMEDDNAKTGIPTSLRTAVLVLRRNDEKFQATVEIETSVDFISNATAKIARALGRTDKEDPIIFDPSLPPTGEFSEMRSKNLEEIDWMNLCKVTSAIATFSDSTQGGYDIQIPAEGVDEGAFFR